MHRSLQITPRQGTALAIGALVLFAACGPAFTTTCRVDRDCPVAQRCDLQQSVCVAAGIDAGDAAVADGALVDRIATDAPAADHANPDRPPTDAAGRDHHTNDTAAPDLRQHDAVTPDATGPDASALDAVALDNRVPDAAVHDNRVPDTVTPDNRVPDTSAPDNQVPDTAVVDTAVADAAQPDSGAVCTGCEIGSPVATCYAAGQHNPLDACEWCDTTHPNRWSGFTGQACYFGASCTCNNGSVVGQCMICQFDCDSTTGACCGSSQQSCCTESPRCQSGLTCNAWNVCASTPGCGIVGHPCCSMGLCADAECDSTFMCVAACGGVGEPCCYPTACFAAESYCCCGTCTTIPSSCDAC